MFVKEKIAQQEVNNSSEQRLGRVWHINEVTAEGNDEPVQILHYCSVQTGKLRGRSAFTCLLHVKSYHSVCTWRGGKEGLYKEV